MEVYQTFQAVVRRVEANIKEVESQKNNVKKGHSNKIKHKCEE